MRRRNLDRKRRADLSIATNETREIDLNQVINGCLRDGGIASQAVTLNRLEFSTKLS